MAVQVEGVDVVAVNAVPVLLVTVPIELPVPLPVPLLLPLLPFVMMLLGLVAKSTK